MKLIGYTSVFLLLIHISTIAQMRRIVSGVIKDGDTQDALPFCNIVLQPKGVKLISINNDGIFKIEIPATVTDARAFISFIGYKPDTLPINAIQNEYVVFLFPNHNTLNEVVFTGVSKATRVKENPISIVSISAKQLDKMNESNVIDALVKATPGLNAVKTGPNISKPFIRGLGYNRVLTLYDGVRQEGQQWGDEHGIEIDTYNLERVEVIKGPASLLYGSDALAGVVSFIPFTYKDSVARLMGRYSTEYQSNNGLVGNSIRLGYKNKNYGWIIRASHRIAKNYTNEIDKRVYNTSFEEKNVSAMFDYRYRKGYLQLNASLYDNLQGIPDGSRDSLTRKFTQQTAEGIADDIKNRPLVTDSELNGYGISPLHQHIQHYRFYTNGFYDFSHSYLRFLLAFQQNIRREYNHPTMPQQAGMYVRLNTVNYGLQYSLPKKLGIETTIGLNGMWQNNQNKDATDFPIPDYELLDGGIYYYLKWKYGSCVLSGGLRYDKRLLQGNDFYVGKNNITGFEQQVLGAEAGSVLQFPAFKQNFEGISYSLGMTYRFTNQINVKVNVARGYRAPSITEIASNGLDPGAHIVYIGNRNFVPEFSWQQDIELSADYSQVSASLSFFNNQIDHYIYLAQAVDGQGIPMVIVAGNKTFQYQQASAQLYGLEAFLAIRPAMINGLRINNSFSFIRGFNRKPVYAGAGIYGEYLPFIPPLQLLSSIQQDIQLTARFLKAMNWMLEVEYHASQHRYLALYDTETLTNAYTLVNVGVGFCINYRKGNDMQLQLQVNNLLDSVYQSNLSRLKYFEYYTASSTGYLGINNMGRNVCLKLLMPF